MRIDPILSGLNPQEETQMNKNKVTAWVFAALLLMSVSYITYQQSQIQNLQMQLDEQMELNRDGSPVGASVYWYKNGIFAYAEHNVMCDLGLNDTAHHIGDQTWVNSNATTNAFKWIAIGTGTGGGAASETLLTEFARASGTFAPVASVNGNWTITYTWTAGSFSGQVITEAGVLNAAALGTLLNYQDFSGITLNVGDSLQVQFMFQAS